MDINNLTIGQAREIASLVAGTACAAPICGPWKLGASYLIRTVTMAQTGRLVAVTEHELVLEDAAWIADLGRFSETVVTGAFAEIEPWPAGRVIIGRAAVIDASEIAFTLPRAKK